MLSLILFVNTQYPIKQKLLNLHSSFIMKLSFDEVDFIMHCIELFAEGSASTANFMDCENKEVCMNSAQINDLYLRLQEYKFSNI
jgi:hypothetical protein